MCLGLMSGCDAATPSGATAARASQHVVSDPRAACACADAVLNHGWCPRCSAGYVAGVRIAHTLLFEAIDAHGHDLARDSFDCESCRAAFDDGAFCAACGIGFFRKQTYFTRLTWSIAQGTAVEPGALRCTTCAGHVNNSGWCETCDQGVVGNVRLTDRTVWEAAARELGVLQAALEKAPTCEMCACAMVLHRTCPLCRVSYEHLAAAAAARPVPAFTLSQGS